jgi:hypothetical protein
MPREHGESLDGIAPCLWGLPGVRGDDRAFVKQLLPVWQVHSTVARHPDSTHSSLDRSPKKSVHGDMAHAFTDCCCGRTSRIFATSSSI